MMQYILALAFTLFSLTSMPAVAGFRDGMDAYETGDFETAVAQWRPLAEEGDPWALYRLGRAYRHAEGVPRDYAQALVLMKKAAAQTANVDVYRRAVYALAYMTEYGHGVEADLEKAECLFRVSAENGYANGQYALAITLRDRKDPSFQSLDWLERAAAQGEPQSLSRLGLLKLWNPFAEPAEAYKYYYLAKRFGSTSSAEFIREAESSTDENELKALEEGRKRAGEWKIAIEQLPTPPIPLPQNCLP